MKTTLRTLALAICATALATACDSPTDPTATPAIDAARRSSSFWWESSTGTTTESGTTTQSAEPTDPTPLRLVEWAPPLTTYDTTFYAVQGRPSTHAIYFQQQPWEMFPVKYMELDIPNGAEFVDASGTPVPRGTIVPITVHADSGVMSFEFGPHGSRFSTRKPATLSVWWLYADLMSLSASGLQLWYQADETESWGSLETQVSFDGFYLSAPIYHFSNYAVAW